MLIAALIALNAFLIDCNNTESPLLIGSFNIQRYSTQFVMKACLY